MNERAKLISDLIAAEHEANRLYQAYIQAHQEADRAYTALFEYDMKVQS